jgi:hypothetical protein
MNEVEKIIRDEQIRLLERIIENGNVIRMCSEMIEILSEKKESNS